MSQPREPSPGDDDVRVLIGEQLSAVVFVQDYLQLDFDGHRLTINIWPAVDAGVTKVVFGEPGYRDALCALIAHRVTEVVVDDSQFEVRFGPGERISCALADHPELEGDRVIFNRADGGYWDAW